MNKAANADHSESAVHNFVDLILLEGSCILSKSERIEAEVAWFVLALDSLLEGVAADALEHSDEEKDLAHAPGGDEVVVSFDGKHVGEIGVGKSPKFLNEHAKAGKHTDAAVFDFGGLEEADIDIIRDEKGVKLEGSGESFEVLRLEQERNTLTHLHGGSGRH